MSDRHDWRLVPSALAAWAAMLAATNLSLAWVGCLVMGALAATAVGWRRRAWTVVMAGLVCAVCLLAGGSRAWVEHSNPVRLAAEQRATVDIVAEITGEPRPVTGGGRGAPQIAVAVAAESVRVRGIEVRGSSALVLLAPAEWHPVVGQRVEATGRLAPTDAGDYAVGLLRVTTTPRTVTEPTGWLALVERLRQGLRDACASLPVASRGLLPALAVGDTSAIPGALTDDLRVTGLTHLCAVSGANLTVLLVFVSLALRWIGVRGYTLHVAAVLTSLGFVLLCRGEPSVIRAAAMGIIGAAAITSSSAVGKGLRHLSVAVIILLVLDPWLSGSAGMALSVLACVGIMVWGKKWSAALAIWLPRPVADALAIPLAAQVATQPLVTALSGNVSAVGILANVVAGPLVSPTTIAGFVSVALAQAWLPAATGLMWCVTPLSEAIAWIAHAGAQLPGASVAVGSHWWIIVLAVLLSIGAAWVLGWALARWWVSILVALALGILLVRGPVRWGWPPPQWLAVFCDVGQGDGAVFNAGDGRVVVVDAGPDAAAMSRCLSGVNAGVIAVAFMTHAHADHYGGAAALVRGRGVHDMVSTPWSSDAATLTRVSDSLGAPLQWGMPGQRWTSGAVEVEMLGPARRVVGESSASSQENESSLVLRVTVGGLRFLMTGDVEPAGQRDLQRSGVDLTADVLKVPHHGSARQEEGFFEASRAGLAVVSVGAHNDFGHPAAKTLGLLDRLGMKVARTDACADVAVMSGPSGPVAVCARAP